MPQEKSYILRLHKFEFNGKKEAAQTHSHAQYDKNYLVNSFYCHFMTTNSKSLTLALFLCGHKFLAYFETYNDMPNYPLADI